MNEEFYNPEIEDLNNSIIRCMDMIEESAGTCNDEFLLPLLEDAHAALDQLSTVLGKYEKEN
jgi:hypothetical protein